MATPYNALIRESFIVASDPKIEGYGNTFNHFLFHQTPVASDPKIEGYGNPAREFSALSLSRLQVTRK